jgi:hypothetical protein
MGGFFFMKNSPFLLRILKRQEAGLVVNGKWLVGLIFEAQN